MGSSFLTGIEPGPSALREQSLNSWAIREVPPLTFVGNIFCLCGIVSVTPQCGSLKTNILKKGKVNVNKKMKQHHFSISPYSHMRRERHLDRKTETHGLRDSVAMLPREAQNANEGEATTSCPKSCVLSAPVCEGEGKTCMALGACWT